MKVSSLSPELLHQKLKNSGIYLRTGSYVSHIFSPFQSIANSIYLLYSDYPFELAGKFADFHISVKAPSNLRRWVRRQALFYVDGVPPFQPLCIDQAFPLFEWGLNWCITTHTHTKLIIHAAVVEKYGFALIMPGIPGSGKSTLCAALINNGWRLLSDELTLVSLTDGLISPLPRPVSLKNESIDVIRNFCSEAVMGEISYDTLKGSVAHMRPSIAHIERANERATPAWIVFPKFTKGAKLSLQGLSNGNSTIRLINDSFNYSILGSKGFSSAVSLVDRCKCYEFVYSDLIEAIEEFDNLADEKLRLQTNG